MVTAIESGSFSIILLRKLVRLASSVTSTHLLHAISGEQTHALVPEKGNRQRQPDVELIRALSSFRRTNDRHCFQESFAFPLHLVQVLLERRRVENLLVLLLLLDVRTGEQSRNV
uniref:(northern house mosquito) hypothetical protein n=1 Tax=Culex pipiens TaxID=7175 RepID=A0A8D8BSZ2_CULPI